jgi:hypothetical protein
MLQFGSMYNLATELASGGAGIKEWPDVSDNSSSLPSSTCVITVSATGEFFYLILISIILQLFSVFYNAEVLAFPSKQRSQSAWR